jgi:hypothetical protein
MMPVTTVKASHTLYNEQHFDVFNLLFTSQVHEIKRETRREKLKRGTEPQMNA